MKIRNALTADLDNLSDLVVWGQSLHVKSHPELFTPLDKDDAKKFLLEWLNSKSSYLRVAEEESTIAGFSFIVVYDLKGSLLRSPRKFAHLDLIAVDPSYQRKGIGSALLKDVREIAKSQGVTRIELDVFCFNEQAQKFYSSHGFSKLKHQMFSVEHNTYEPSIVKGK